MQKQISAIISMKDRFSGPLLKMSKNIEGVTKETQSSMHQVNRWGKQVERSVDRAIKATVKWAKRGAILATGWSFKSGMEGATELDYAARKVKSIAGERLDMSAIRQDIKDFSFEFGKAYEEIGDGMYNAISANIPIDLLNEAIELGNKLSIAGFTDMDSSISLMASTMNAFDMKTSEEMQNMADQFLLTQNLGVITVDEMAQYYGRISTLSGQIGASLEEQNAAMATMTMRGMTQREATTSYRSILNAFLNNTSESQQAAIEAMGLSGDFLTAKTFDKLGFDGVVNELAKAAKGDLDLISEIFPDIRGKIGAIMFSPDAGMDDYKRILEELSDPDGILDDAHAELNNSVERQWDIFKKRIKTLNDELYTEEDGIGGYLVEQLRKANDWLEKNRDDIIKKANEISKGIIEAIKGIGKSIKENKTELMFFAGFLFTLYGTLKLFKNLGEFSRNLNSIREVIDALSLGKIVSDFPMMLVFKVAIVIIAVGAAIKYMYDNWDDLMEQYPYVETVINKIKEIIKELAPIIKFVAGVVGWAFGAFFKIIGRVPEMLSDMFMGVIMLVGGAFQTILGLIIGTMGILVYIITGDAEIMKTGFGIATDGMSNAWEGFATMFAAPVEAVLDLMEEKFGEGVKNLTTKWEAFKKFFEAPISSTVNFVRDKFHTDKDRIMRNGKVVGYVDPEGRYKGTPSWKGGPVKVHERGGEIMDLPGGTRIYPHDESVRMARSEGAATVAAAGVGGQSISVNLGGINFSGDFNTEADINEIGTKIVNTIKKELKNI